MCSHFKGVAASGADSAAVVVTTGAAPFPHLPLGSEQPQVALPLSHSPLFKPPGNHTEITHLSAAHSVAACRPLGLLPAATPLLHSSPQQHLKAALQVQHLMVNLGVDVEQAEAALEDILRALCNA
jgi:hypothetical protein